MTKIVNQSGKGSNVKTLNQEILKEEKGAPRAGPQVGRANLAYSFERWLAVRGKGKSRERGPENR